MINRRGFIASIIGTIFTLKLIGKEKTEKKELQTEYKYLRFIQVTLNDIKTDLWNVYQKDENIRIGMIVLITRNSKSQYIFTKHCSIIHDREVEWYADGLAELVDFLNEKNKTYG